MPNLPTSDLLELLTSPDPEQRDEIAYTQLAERISAGAEDGQLLLIGERLVKSLRDENVYARSFASLVLAEVLTRDAVIRELDRQTIQSWMNAFAQWYLGEEDLRGFDAHLGWLHSVAHGADAIGAFGQAPHLGRVELTELLVIARDRVLSSRTTLFANHEDDRVALAMALVLTRPELSPAQRVSWLKDVEDALSSGRPGPVPAWVSNTLHTLRALYLLVDRGGRLPGDPSIPISVPDRKAVADAIASAVRKVFPFME